MQRTALVQVRMTPAEKALAGERAAAAGETVSEFARGLLLGRAAPKKNRGVAVEFPVSPEVRAQHRREIGAAELERGGLGSLEGTSGSGSAAPAVDHAAGDAAESSRTGAIGPGGLVPVFRCPWDSCGYRAKSPRVSCPTHGRKVVPL